MSKIVFKRDITMLLLFFMYTIQYQPSKLSINIKRKISALIVLQISYR